MKEKSTTNELEIISQEGICPTCPLCKHAARDRVTEIYFEKNKSIKKTVEWFNDKFEKKFSEEEFKKHLKEHIEPFVTEEEFTRKLQINVLKQRSLSSQRENNLRFNIMKQMTWELMQDVYLSKPKKIESSSDRTEQQKTVKQFIDLSKSFRETWQMELNLLGMGKTEEEMKTDMKNYMAGMMRQAINSLGHFPEAKRELSDFWDTHMGGNKKTENTIVDQEPPDGV